MDLADPTRSVTPTLDGTVLAVLAMAGRPLTVGEVAQQAVRGSEIGIRRCLARLVDQGLVRAVTMGRTRVHELNRDHLAAGVADVLAGLRLELWRRFRDEIDSWRPAPIFACVFGSAARGDGSIDSDIDLLLVHPLLPGEHRPSPPDATAPTLLAGAIVHAGLVTSEPDEERRWGEQVTHLRGLAERWTGNALQVIDLSFAEWQQAPEQSPGLIDDIRRDGIELYQTQRWPIWSAGARTSGRG